MKRMLPVTWCFVLLTACSTGAQTNIQFMGVSPGGMQTTLEELQFGDRFPASIKEFVAVISLGDAVDGTVVEATWFSPDDRTMPLGRTAIVTQSGATIARFTLATTQEWEPAPYKLLVDVKDPKNFQTTATGSLQFFIGMTDTQIESYQTEWTEYDRRHQEEIHALQLAGEFEQSLAVKAEEALQAPALLGLKKDIVGDENHEYVFLDTRNQEAYIPGETPTVNLEAAVQQFVVLGADGAEVLSVLQNGRTKRVRSHSTVIATLPVSGGIRTSFLTTGTWVLQWEAGGESCVQELRKVEDGYEAAEAVCS